MSILSIVIPATGEGARWEITLASVLQHRPAEAEVIVVFPGSYDDPYQLKDEVRFVELSGRATLLDCLRAGCQAASAEIVHLLGPGIQVEEGWTDQVIRHFADPSVAAVAPLVVDPHSDSITCGVDYVAGRRQTFQYDLADLQLQSPWGPELRGAFYRASALGEIGSLPCCVGTEWADLDVAASLRALGYRTVVEPYSRLDAGDYLPPPAPGAWHGGLFAERFLWRSRGDAGWAAAMVRPLGALRDCAGAGSLGSAVLNLFGRAIAWLQPASYRRHREQLRSLGSHKRQLAPSEPTKLGSETLRFDVGHPQFTAALRKTEAVQN